MLVFCWKPALTLASEWKELIWEVTLPPQNQEGSKKGRPNRMR